MSSRAGEAAALTPLGGDAKGENTPIRKRDTQLMVTNVFSRRKRGEEGFRNLLFYCTGELLFLKAAFSKIISKNTPLFKTTFRNAG